MCGEPKFIPGKATKRTRPFGLKFTLWRVVMKVLSLGRLFRRRRTYRAAVKELSSFSDHELQDIGIVRADIRTIAHQMSKEQQ